MDDRFIKPQACGMKCQTERPTINIRTGFPTRRRVDETTAAPRTVLETILDWSVDRPMWQRDVLRRIIAVGTPNDAAIAELLALCKKEHGATGFDPEPVALEAAHLPASPANGASVTITSLSDIVGVNQLAPGQTLPFETAGLT
ncbi:hypothetical protein [Bradyrhizobium canariense]|uniref:hypothetical protein n=1 Tax=Bradyrhizobium canariense TaxID=255045 RepID=UPI001FD8BEB3|nr:hypothetical protein [Bradyrhizobium canariense]